MDSPLSPGAATAMSATDHLQCSCGYLAFRCISFPEPGVMQLTCFGCGQTHTINVSAASNLVAWNATTPTSPARVVPEQLESVKAGYKYESMF
jgi:hypothetical protein